LENDFNMAASLFSAPPEKKIGHLYAVDFARGLAALSILVWHYQQFFFPNADTPKMTVPRESQPFYHQLSIFYQQGAHAVEFFWLISGFVFAAVYVVGKRTTTREFASNRFARLYPLHFLTLLIVALLQIISLRLVGHEQIVGNNDLWHFILNVFFASSWGNQQNLSFNAPIWSVSVEVLIYALFWLSVTKLYRFGIAGPAVLALAAWLIHFHFMGAHEDQDYIFYCIFYFFAGTTLFLLIDATRPKPLVLLLASAALIGIDVAP
jgi:peptidoglycan/LPS O-acetylase OafA/YrhL